MEKAFQERQQDIGAQTRFATSSAAILNDSHNGTSWMDPRLAYVITLSEGFLQTTDEESNTLKLFSIELMLPFWRGASLLAIPNELVGYMRRSSQSVRGLNPFTLSRMLQHIVHHCIVDGLFGDVVNTSPTLYAAHTLHMLDDGIMHVECCGQHSRGRAITSLQLLEVHVVARRQAAQL